MPFWFEKNEHRRFKRINMPVKVFVTPSSADLINNKQIFALNIDYFPPSVLDKIKDTTEKMNHWFSLVQEQQEVLEPVFKALVSSVEFLGEQVAEVSKGRSPKVELLDWKAFCDHSAGIKSIKELKKSAPKTHQYLEQMNIKLMAYYGNFQSSIEKSTPKKFYVDDRLSQEFMADSMIAKFDAASFSKIPLVQSLKQLHKLMGHYYAAYDEFIRDYYYRQNPKAWETKQVNISAGGISILMHKRFRQNTRCQVYLYFVDSERLLNVNSSLVRTSTEVAEKKECNAFNFEFPDGQDQIFIQYEMERYEWVSSMHVKL